MARALVNRADIIIADEPTGNIDPEMSKEIVDLLNQINMNDKTTIIMVTHAVDLIKQYDKRIIKISNGSIISDSMHPEIEEEHAEEFTEVPTTSFSGFYHAPTEDAEIEDFISSYGIEITEKMTDGDDAADMNTRSDNGDGTASDNE